MSWVAKKKFCRLKISNPRNWLDCFCAREFFVTISHIRSERLLLILHMALQLLYQNFVHTFNPASYAG